MSRCSKCGFPVPPHLTASHERLCGGKVVEREATLSEELIDDIDGGEECRGRDSQLTRWIEMARKLEWKLEKATQALDAITHREDLYHGWQTEIANAALEAIGETP